MPRACRVNPNCVETVPLQRMESPSHPDHATQNARERLGYLETIYARVSRYDQLIQNYELQMFTALSVLVSVDVILLGVLNFFRLNNALLWALSTSAIGVAGIGLAALFNRRIQYFVLQRDYVEDIASKTEAVVLANLFSELPSSERDQLMTSKSLIDQKLARQPLLLRLTFYSYILVFALVIFASSVLAYLITQ